MIDRDAPRALRLQFAAAILAFVGLGGIGAWVGATTLAHVLSRSAAHVPLVEFRPLYVTGLPVAVAFLALTVLALLPKETGKQQRGTRRRVRATHVTFGVVIGSMLLTVITTSLATFAMADVMRRRGYSACPATGTERHPPMRWVRDGGWCP